MRMLVAGLTALMAAGLGGCDARQQVMTDDVGCKWAVTLEKRWSGWKIIWGSPIIVSAGGRPMCGVPSSGEGK